jgi:hypothetical protein
MVAHNDSARNSRLYDEDERGIKNVMQTGQVEWRHTTANWGYDIRELAMCSGASEIVSILKERRVSGLVSLAEKMEENVWGTPADADDDLTPHGVDYWIVENASEGLYGTNRFGSTTGGINPTTYDQWCNWTAQYTTVNKTDLVRKWRKAFYFCKFRSPVPTPTHNWGGSRGYYTNYSVLGTIEELLEAQNDSLGKDIASMDGSAVFRGTPITWVPYLEDDTKNPLIGISWQHFRPVFLRGLYMTESKPKEGKDSHMTRYVDIDCTYNFVCRNRREQFRIETA